MKRLEGDKNILLKVIVTSGDFHHMAMKFWLEEFPDVKFVHSSLKFPQTRNGMSILKNEEWKKRIELVTGDSFPSLDAYRDTVQFFGFDQCETIPDKEFTSSDSKNLTNVPTFKYLKSIIGETKKSCNIKFLSIWMYHIPSKTLAVEHNFGLYVNLRLKKQHLSLLGKLLLPTEKFVSVGKGPNPKLPSTEKDCSKHCQQMQTCLELDVRSVMDYHYMQGTTIRDYDSKAAYQCRQCD